MKYIEKFESKGLEYQLNDWINDVIANCKSIMIELQDMGMIIEVKRSLYITGSFGSILNNFGNSVLVDCTMSYPTAYKWSKFGLKDIYDRLNEYMKTEGFEEIERSTGDVSRFPFLNGMYQAKISFKKDNLDSDYIGSLRFLKRYNIE